MTRSLYLAQTEDANRLLAVDPFALLIGMLLDQQFPMERAFSGPHLLAQRLGFADHLDPCRLLDVSVADLESAAAGPPAIHRYPKAMADRVRQVAEIVCEQYGGDTARIWGTADDAQQLLQRIVALPGFGQQKARIFLALLGKQFAVELRDWRSVCEPYGDVGTHRSIADVVDGESLDRVRAFKREQKRAERG